MRKIILFDFDGVIMDSFEGTFEVSKVFKPALTKESLRQSFEGNIIDNFWDAKGKRTRGEEYNEFCRIYGLAMMNFRIFPGMLDAIKSLAENYTLIIVSSTISGPIREYVESHNMAQYFAEIMGGDIHKSKVEKIKMVFEKYEVKPEDCVFITDTLGDLREAEKTGLQGIAVTWGFHNRETLAQGKPVAFAEKPEDLAEKIKKYFENRQ